MQPGFLLQTQSDFADGLRRPYICFELGIKLWSPTYRNVGITWQVAGFRGDSYQTRRIQQALGPNHILSRHSVEGGAIIYYLFIPGQLSLFTS